MQHFGCLTDFKTDLRNFQLFLVEPILPPRVIQQKRNVEMGETNTFSSRRTSCGIFCDGEYTFVLQHFIGTDGCKSSKQF